MLAIPASTFVYIDGGRITFFNGLTNLLQGYGMLTGIVYFLGLLVTAHYLLVSIKPSLGGADH